MNLSDDEELADQRRAYAMGCGWVIVLLVALSLLLLLAAAIWRAL